MFDDPDGSVTGGRRDVIHKRSGVYVYVGAYVSLTNNNHPPRSRCLLVGKRVVALACQLVEVGSKPVPKIQNETQNRPRVLTDDWIE